jgi:hypothetical protein
MFPMKTGAKILNKFYQIESNTVCCNDQVALIP